MYLLYKPCVSLADLPGTSHVYIITATINSISHPWSWAQSSPSKMAGFWYCPAQSWPSTDVNINFF